MIADQAQNSSSACWSVEAIQPSVTLPSLRCRTFTWLTVRLPSARVAVTMTHPVGVVGEQIVHLGAEGAGGLVGQRPEQREHLLFAAVVPRQRIATGHVPDDAVGEQFTEPNQVAGGEGPRNRPAARRDCRWALPPPVLTRTERQLPGQFLRWTTGRPVGDLVTAAWSGTHSTMETTDGNSGTGPDARPGSWQRYASAEFRTVEQRRGGSRRSRVEATKGISYDGVHAAVAPGDQQPARWRGSDWRT